MKSPGYRQACSQVLFTFSQENCCNILPSRKSVAYTALPRKTPPRSRPLQRPRNYAKRQPPAKKHQLLIMSILLRTPPLGQVIRRIFIGVTGIFQLTGRVQMLKTRYTLVPDWCDGEFLASSFIKGKNDYCWNGWAKTFANWVGIHNWLDR